MCADVECVRLSAEQGDSFSFKTFETQGGGTMYTNNITAGHYCDFPYGPKPEE